VLDPAGFAAFEATLLSALDGPTGLAATAILCGALDAELRSAATAYEDADALGTRVHDAIQGVVDLPVALATAGATLIADGDPLRAAQTVVVEDPGLADDAAAVIGLPALAAGATRILPDGHGVARDLGVDTRGPAARPPRSLPDVLDDLVVRAEDTSHHGAIDVRVLTLPDGSRRAIVDISGTKSWTPLPTSDVTSLTTNGRALIGRSGAYEGGVLAAMRRAGVRRTDQVMIVGHSEGGIVAVTTARDALATGEFDVTHVVTTGAPIGRTIASLPPRVQVLALENNRDVVPHLDGVANPDRANVVTVSARRGDGTIVGDHRLDTVYRPLSADVAASTDDSVTHFLDTAHGYFEGRKVVTHMYQIVRAY
jgi:hypothetical protein